MYQANHQPKPQCELTAVYLYRGGYSPSITYSYGPVAISTVEYIHCSKVICVLLLPFPGIQAHILFALIFPGKPLPTRTSTMRGFGKTLACCGLWFHAATTFYHAPQGTVTVIHTVNLCVRQEPNPSEIIEQVHTAPLIISRNCHLLTVCSANVAAIVPTEPGQIGVNPPGTEPT